MNDADMSKLFEILEDINETLDFDIIMFVCSNKRNLKGGMCCKDNVNVNYRKIDIVDMIGYMLKNADVKLEDIMSTMRLKKEESKMLGLIKLIDEMED